jgi:hypothetical protein
MKAIAWLAGLLVAIGVGVLLLMPRITLEPPRRAGPPALVAQNDADPQLWIVTEQEERESAGRGVLEEKNATLRGVLPEKLEFFAFDDGLVVTAADARRYRVSAGDWQAREYQARSDDHFRAISFQATQWNGGYRTADFLARHGMPGGRWLGIYSDAEAADAGADGFGDRYSNSANVRSESGPVRRALRSARIGRTKVFSEGSHLRLFDVVAIPGTADFLGGGFLVAAGTKAPLELSEPPGVLVVHQTRADAQGRIAMTRLGPDLRPTWNVVLPYAELLNRWQLRDRLLLFGSFPVAEAESFQHHEAICRTSI